MLLRKSVWRVRKHETQSNRESCVFHFSHFELYIYIYMWEVCLLIISLYGAWYVEVECNIYWGREKNKETILSSLQAWEIHTPFVYIFHVHIQIATFLKKGCIYMYLSHKLRCYTEISGSEKSRNDARKKISYFFTRVDIANQLLTRNSPLAPLGQFDEWTAKPSRFSIQIVCRSFLELWQLKH